MIELLFIVILECIPGQVMSIKPGFPDHAIVKGYIEPIEQEAENE